MLAIFPKPLILPALRQNQGFWKNGEGIAKTKTRYFSEMPAVQAFQKNI